MEMSKLGLDDDIVIAKIKSEKLRISNGKTTSWTSKGWQSHQK